MINELKKLMKSFSYASDGVSFCIKHERNFRIHLVAIFYVLIFAYLAKISIIEFGLLIICFAQVISAELLNTAIEVLCDKESSGYNSFIKRAKDIAAAAVLVCAVGCIILGAVIFIPKSMTIINNINLINLAVIIFTIPISLVFIFKRRK